MYGSISLFVSLSMRDWRWRKIFVFLVCRAPTTCCKKASSLPCYYIIATSYTLVKKLVQTARQGEEKVIFFCLCICLLSQLNYWSWRKIDGARKQNKTCAYVFSWPPKSLPSRFLVGEMDSDENTCYEFCLRHS